MDRLPITGGKTLAHRYRGVPDADLSQTPRGTQPTVARQVESAPAPESAIAQTDPVLRQTAVSTAPRDANPLWERGPRAMADDPFGESGGPPRVVNVFGEMDGQPAPKPGATGEAGFQQHTFTDEGADADVCIDPTGKWLLYASTRHSEHSDLYMQRTDGTSVIQLTSETAGAAYPCFSPDGKQIAFASTRSGPWQIYVMDSDGRNVVQVTTGTMQCLHPSFSPDGARLVYSAIGSRSNQWELWTANLATNEKRMVGYGLFPRWSPDKAADRIAFQRARQRGSRWFSLWTVDLIEGEGRRLTEVAASANAALVSPCWSPDGRHIAFSTIVEPGGTTPPGEPGGPGRPGRGGVRDKTVKHAARRGRQDVWTLNADGSNRQRLTDGNGMNLSPWWAPDNRVFFISDRGGNECVWSVRADPPRVPSVAGGGGVPGDAGDKDAAAAADPRDAEH